MPGVVLLDTGPLVAWLDPDDAGHDRCVDWLRLSRDRFVTTEAVLTEALFLLESPAFRRRCFELLRGLRVRFFPVTQEGLDRADELLAKYADVPMDYADASLVVTAESLDEEDVLTLDVRDFSIYRIHGRRSFRLVLPPA